MAGEWKPPPSPGHLGRGNAQLKGQEGRMHLRRSQKAWDLQPHLQAGGSGWECAAGEGSHSLTLSRLRARLLNSHILLFGQREEEVHGGEWSHPVGGTPSVTQDTHLGITRVTWPHTHTHTHTHTRAQSNRECHKDHFPANPTQENTSHSPAVSQPTPSPHPPPCPALFPAPSQRLGCLSGVGVGVGEPSGTPQNCWCKRGTGCCLPRGPRRRC